MLKNSIDKLSGRLITSRPDVVFGKTGDGHRPKIQRTHKMKNTIPVVEKKLC